MAPRYTVGIEEEYQIIDPESRELTSYVQKFLEQGQMVLKDQIKPELLQSQVEVLPGIFLSHARLLVVALAVILLGVLGWLSTSTRTGVSWRATVADPDMARSLARYTCRRRKISATSSSAACESRAGHPTGGRSLK